jgi:hypothetical protein
LLEESQEAAMGTDFSIKPVGAPVATPLPPPPVSGAVEDAVATELPATQSATAVPASASAGGDPGPANPYFSHQVVVDQAAASIVYRVVDDRTDQVVEQFPDDAILRRRAYFRTLDLAGDPPRRPIVTDRRA